MTDFVADRPMQHMLPLWLRLAPRAVFDRVGEERDRWPLWLPVAQALGIALYFSLPSEPPLWLGAAATFIACLVMLGARRSLHRLAPPCVLIGVVGTVIAAGFLLAEIETWRVAAPMLDHPLGIVSVDGAVVDIERMTDGTRVTLIPDQIGTLRNLPRTIRVKLRAEFTPPEIGDHIRMKASLMPPPGPALPGGFDFQRQAFFRGLGAVGYAVGTPIVTPRDVEGRASALRRLRLAITARIQAILPPETAAIAAALITGERGAVPPAINQDYRDSGLAHLLVIAGLHMTLVTGFVFFAVRLSLALIPSVALRYPIKKWAALAALLVACLYLMISGAAVPTQRAFVMVALGLVAIMIDRLHLSMSGVAWAAALVLALDPSALAGVSFQMSFAAVVGLVSFYETFGPRLALLRGSSGPLGRGGLHLIGIALTTLVATAGTAAFSIYHFNRFALFSVVANVVAVPLAGFWVMPWAFVACLMMPFHLEAIGLVPMGWGLVAIETVAHWTATLPLAVLDLPRMPDWGLVSFTLGGLWLALWRGPWRRWGLGPMAIGVASLWFAQVPDIIAAADGKLVAIRMGDRYILSSTKADRLDAEEWLRAAGGIPGALLPEPGKADGGIRCDRAACLWQSPHGPICLLREPAALAEDCRTTVLIVALIPVPRACRTTTLVIDHSDLRKGGTTSIQLGDRIIIETANGDRGNRPWVIIPGSANSAGSGRSDAPEP